MAPVETVDRYHVRMFRAVCPDCSYRSQYVGSLPDADERLAAHRPRCRYFRPKHKAKKVEA